MTYPMLIDTDTASDDAVALIMALNDSKADVVAITVVAGNVGLDNAVQNALYVVDMCGASVPVFAGADRPLVRSLETAQNVHGADGMGDIGLELQGRSPVNDRAVEEIIRQARAHAGELTLVTLGPLTNVALAVRAAPDIVSCFRRVVMMGGIGQGPGNVTELAEFNIWVDPEAADVVFTSGLPLEMVGWDVSRSCAVISGEDAQRLRSISGLGGFVVDINGRVAEFCSTTTKLDGFDLPDPITMAAALDPSLITESRRLHVRVETGGTYGRGQTVVDHLGVTGMEPNTTVVFGVSRDGFLAMLEAAVEGRSGAIDRHSRR